MQSYRIMTQLFGELIIPAADGLMEKYSVSINNKEIDLMLDIEDNLLNDKRVPILEDIIRQIPDMYNKAKKYIYEHIQTNQIIQFFIRDQLAELDTLPEIFDVEDDSDISYEMFAEKLEPRMISISLNNTTHTIDCIFDFSLPEDYSDELLVICFDDQYNIYHITHES